MKQADAGSSWTLEQERTASTVNEITDITNTVGSAWTEPDYDPAGNMISIAQPLAMGSSCTATWDAWNRLVKLVDGSDVVAEYAYDGAKRRIVKKIYVSGSLSETRHLYHSHQWQIVEERVDSGTSAVKQFIWGLRYIDDLLLRDRTVSDPLDERLYALQEVQWNVVALADVDGDIQQRFAYHPYGASIVLADDFTSTTDAYEWEHRFTGREHDLETGLDYFRNRYWHAILGVFIGRDSLGYVDGMNLHAGWFVPNEIDPNGLKSVISDCLSKNNNGECSGCCANVEQSKQLECLLMCREEFSKIKPLPPGEKPCEPPAKPFPWDTFGCSVVCSAGGGFAGAIYVCSRFVNPYAIAACQAVVWGSAGACSAVCDYYWDI
jgi:RHS repeat-associated protein